LINRNNQPNARQIPQFDYQGQGRLEQFGAYKITGASDLDDEHDDKWRWLSACIL
jgi:hypothetical protein